MGGELVVAIDGQAGAGKTTLASALAKELRLPYVNTGLMYRAVTDRALVDHVDLDDGPSLALLARRTAFDLDPNSNPVSLVIDGAPPRPELTSSEVEREVSRVSAHPEVRAVLREEQRRLGETGAVMEGRDIGSVVFPDAAVKVFLLAEEDQRASRRALERAEGPERPEIAEELARRDARDARVTPPVPAEDAVVIDTNALGPEAVLREVLALALERLPRTR
jgi:cytidylate kinase